MIGPRTSCARCQRVLALEVSVDGHTYDEDSPEEVEVDVAAGALMAVCNNCLTDREAWEGAIQGAARLLEVAEDALADYSMVFERVPTIRDDPGAQAAYAEARRQAASARSMLDALLANEPDEEATDGAM